MLKNFFKPKEENEQNLCRVIVINSHKKYKTKTLNIIRDCLNCWCDQLRKCMDIYTKCPLDFSIREFDNETFYMVRLTTQQASMWNINCDDIDRSDLSHINPLYIFDTNEYFDIFISQTQQLYK